MSEVFLAAPDGTGGPTGCCGGTAEPGTVVGAPGTSGTVGGVTPGRFGIPDGTGERPPLAIPYGTIGPWLPIPGYIPGGSIIPPPPGMEPGGGMKPGGGTF